MKKRLTDLGRLKVPVFWTSQPRAVEALGSIYHRRRAHAFLAFANTTIPMLGSFRQRSLLAPAATAKSRKVQRS